MFKKTFKILIFFLLIQSAFSEDSLTSNKNNKSYISIHKPSLHGNYLQNPAENLLDTIIVNTEPLFQNNQLKYVNSLIPDTVSGKRFLWLSFKNIEDLFNYFTGFYVKNMDVGQIQNLSVNQLDYNNIGLLRNGRQLNDLFDGSIDFNLLSRNEISEIELLNSNANSLYPYNSIVNIIQKQVFRNKPYSEISYVQDRFENLFFDANLHQNISKKINFNFGATKHSCDGKYENSDFDKWLGRFNLNLLFNNKFNIYLFSNYAKIKRGLNEGIDPSQVTAFDKTTLFDISKAIVKNPDAYEIKERIDVDLGLFLANRNKTLLTDARLFVSNSFREYIDDENRSNPNGKLVKDNTHWIDYGMKLKQIINFNIFKTVKFNLRAEIEYHKDYFSSNFSSLNNSDRLFLFSDFKLTYKNISVNSYIRSQKYKYFDNKFYFDFGVKPAYQFFSKDTLTAVNAYISYSMKYKLPTYQQYFLTVNYNNKSYYPLELLSEKLFCFDAGINFKYIDQNIQINYFNYKINNYILSPFFGFSNDKSNSTLNFSGFNTNLNLKIYKFEVQFNSAYNIKVINQFTPVFNGSASLSYHNTFFKDKFELKVGLTSRFHTSADGLDYYGYYNGFSDRLDTFSLMYYVPRLDNNITLDFFIMGKISTAVFGFTFENILNRLYYNTNIYPFIDRGGFANVLSRFNLTWYFLD